jgi:ABC-type polysaccharide transport system permease subunit
MAKDKKEHKKSLCKKILPNLDLYFLMLVPLVYLIVFKYIPMYGAQIAFKDFNAVKGIIASPWVGLKHFQAFFKSYAFGRVLKNTLGISLYSLMAGFPIPILLAMMFNYIGSRRLRRISQMITYAPHFISTVVRVGMILQFLAQRNGLLNNLIALAGGRRIDFMGTPEYFWSVYVWSGIWQSMGYSSIIYISALSGVDPELHESAVIDGASIPQRIRHIDIPSILPTIIILLILSCGNILSVGYEKIYLMQNSLNLSYSEVISTYVYKVGLASPLGNYSYASAIGLFTAVINLILLVSVNQAAKMLNSQSLW